MKQVVQTVLTCTVEFSMKPWSPVLSSVLQQGTMDLTTTVFREWARLTFLLPSGQQTTKTPLIEQMIPLQDTLLEDHDVTIRMAIHSTN